MTIQRTGRTARWSAVLLSCAALASCGQADMAKCDGVDPATLVAPTAAVAAAVAAPAPVNGWAEYPLAEGVVRMQPAKWRSDVIRIPVPAKGGDLEYKLGMKAGDAVVYSIDFGDIEHPGLFVSEFHGHTEKRADGVGDLMFYSKTGVPSEHGQFVAPWDGIHGWYLKNDSERDAVITLQVAGYYEILPE